MKNLFLLALLISASALADPTPLTDRQFSDAFYMSTQTWIQCDTSVTTLADGTPSVSTSDCVVRYKVGTTNYCVKASTYSFFSRFIGRRVSVREALNNLGTLWTWEETEVMPIDADARCAG